MEIIKGKSLGAYMAIVYGVPGIGKSTWASQAPAPLFIDLEGGLARIECDKTPRVSEWGKLLDALRFAYQSDYKTIVLDTIDGLEELIRKEACKIYNWKSIESAGYGKGYVAMCEILQEVLIMCEKLKEKGKSVIFVGHEVIKTHQAPDQDAFDRYILKMNAKLSAILVGRVDACFFCQYETHLKTDRTNEERLRAVGTGKRIMRTQEAPAWIAKNRFGLEPTIAMDATVFEQLV